MSKWHQYPQHPDAHPEKPWWRKQYKRRGDGSLEHLAWRRTDGRMESALAVERGLIDILDAIDREHPLPPPEPRCGQVWKVPGRPADMAVTEEWPWSGKALAAILARNAAGQPALAFDRTWPPPGAVLVAGPGAPWAPMGGDDG